MRGGKKSFRCFLGQDWDLTGPLEPRARSGFVRASFPHLGRNLKAIRDTQGAPKREAVGSVSEQRMEWGFGAEEEEADLRTPEVNMPPVHEAVTTVVYPFEPTTTALTGLAATPASPINSYHYRGKY